MLPYDRNKVGSYLKAIRKAANLTQTEVSQRVGHSSAQFISNLERGAAVAPIGLLAKLTKIYKIDPTALTYLILGSQEKLLREFFKKEMKKKR